MRDTLQFFGIPFRAAVATDPPSFGQVVDKYMTAIGEFTMGEAAILSTTTEENEYVIKIGDLGTEEHFDYEWPASLPKPMWGTELSKIAIPKSKFGTYCKNVLSRVYQYLQKGQVVYKLNSGKVCCMHGGYPMRETLLDGEGNDQPGFLETLAEKDLNTVLASEKMSAMFRSVPPFAIPDASAYGSAALTIVGHKPQLTCIPRVTKLQGHEQYLVQMDLQRCTRTSVAACVAFNDEGEFAVLASIPYKWSPSTGTYTQTTDGSTTRVLIVPDEHTPTIPHNKGEEEFAGYDLDDVSGDLKAISVKCTDTTSDYSCSPAFQRIEKKEPSEFAKVIQSQIRSESTDPAYVFTHVAWGDVEGNKHFAQNCARLAQQLLPETHEPTLVILGDNVGVAEYEKANPPKDIDEPECMKWAIGQYLAPGMEGVPVREVVRIVGNRDLNKMRLPWEFIWWVHWVKNNYGLELSSGAVDQAALQRAMEGTIPTSKKEKNKLRPHTFPLVPHPDPTQPETLMRWYHDAKAGDSGDDIDTTTVLGIATAVSVTP